MFVMCVSMPRCDEKTPLPPVAVSGACRLPYQALRVLATSIGVPFRGTDVERLYQIKRRAKIFKSAELKAQETFCVNGRDTAPTLGRGQSAGRSSHAALSPQLLQPIAPQPPPTAHRASISNSTLSDASIVSSNDQKSSKSPRFARDPASAGARANRNQSAPRQLQHGGLNMDVQDSAERHASPTSQHSGRSTVHGRFPPSLGLAKNAARGALRTSRRTRRRVRVVRCGSA
jgi:hypothetical protein